MREILAEAPEHFARCWFREERVPDTVRVLCAWCNATIRAGDASREASHGICVHCATVLNDSCDQGRPPARDDPQAGPTPS